MENPVTSLELLRHDTDIISYFNLTNMRWFSADPSVCCVFFYAICSGQQSLQLMKIIWPWRSKTEFGICIHYIYFRCITVCKCITLMI